MNSAQPPRLSFEWFQTEMRKYDVPDETIEKLWRGAREVGRRASAAALSGDLGPEARNKALLPDLDLLGEED